MNTFESISHTIKSRRSTKPSDMNGKKIDNTLIKQLLELADWAPTHARTEPWRFIVYEGDAKTTFCLDHAELYKANTDPEKFTTAKYQKIIENGEAVSHIVLVYMKRAPAKPIPALEEIAAVSSAIQNILLGAEALNISTLWSTGGMAHHSSLKNYLGLGEEDIVMGLLFMGYSDLPAGIGKRNIPLEEKIVWKS
jgi:nitroreductase